MQAVTELDRLFVENLIREASDKFIMPRWKRLRATDILSEDPDDPAQLVTLADVQAEEYLCDRLKKKYPGVTVIGEEASKQVPQEDKHEYFSKLSTEQFVITLDPVDGTNYFCRKDDDRFATIVGHWHYGRMEEVWIARHAIDLTVYARRGHGTYIDGVRVSPISSANLADTDVFKSILYSHGEFESDLSRLSSDTPASVAPSLGTAGEITDYLIECRSGRPGSSGVLLVKKRDNPWDYVASLAIQEAGGFAWNENCPDEPHRFVGATSNHVVASSPGLGREVANHFFGANLHPGEGEDSGANPSEAFGFGRRF